MRGYLTTMARILSSVLYISIVTPLFLLGMVPIVCIYYFAQRYYIKTSRELTRIESITRSPIYAMFSETIDGSCVCMYVCMYSNGHNFCKMYVCMLDVCMYVCIYIFRNIMYV